MIRRAFWLGAGATMGIMTYRRVCAIGHKVSGRVTGAPSARATLRETFRFARDVREGMDLYYKRQDQLAASNLRSPQTHDPDQKDGR
jgi:hypothetical protein